jgi:hypothetical protein
MAKNSGGITARNTRQGYRAEYIVKYIFTAFGTAVDVSAENDLGLDLLCNLTSFDGLVIIYKSSFGIQVKCKGYLFKYKGKQATKWLSKLEFPILLVEVDKENSNIKVFSTWNLNRFLLGFHSDDENNYPDQVVFDTNDYGELKDPNLQTGEIPVGKPIVEFNYTDINDEDKCKLYHEVLTEWLEMDDNNYKLRRAGISRAYGFINWTTNAKPSNGVGFNIHYSYSPYHNNKINELLKYALAAQGLYYKHSSDGGKNEDFKKRFNELKLFVDKYIKGEMGDYEKGIFEADL